MLSGYYASGLCANKLKKETKKIDMQKEVLFCTVGRILSIFVLILNLFFHGYTEKQIKH